MAPHHGRVQVKRLAGHGHTQVRPYMDSMLAL